MIFGMDKKLLNCKLLRELRKKERVGHCSLGILLMHKEVKKSTSVLFIDIFLLKHKNIDQLCILTDIHEAFTEEETKLINACDETDKPFK